MTIKQVIKLFKIKFSFRKHLLKQYLAKNNFIPSTLILILIILELLIIGGIFIETSSSQRVYECQSTTPWVSLPIRPNETSIMSFNKNSYTNMDEREIMVDSINVAPSQSCSIEINTSDIACIKIFTFEVWNDDNFNYFDLDYYYYVENITEFKLTIKPQQKNSLYIVFIFNPNEAELHYEGKIIIEGINQDYFILIAVPLIFLIPIIIVDCIIRRERSLLKTRNSNSRKNESNSFLQRLSLLWSLNEREYNKLYVIVIVIIIWFVVEPIIPIYENFSAGSKINNLIGVDLLLIEPLQGNFFFLGVLMFIEISEIVTGKIKRKEVISLFSLPISKTEWLFIVLLRMLLFYGGIFGLLFFMKALLISLQTKLLLPINSFILWFPFLILFLLLWGIFGLLVAIKSKNQITSSIISLITVFIFSILPLTLTAGNPESRSSGFFNIEKLIYQIWFLSLKQSSELILKVNSEFPFFLIVPYLEVFLLDIIINIVLICICLVLLVKASRNFEIS